MLWIYRLLFLPSLVLAAPYYLWRMRRRGGYGQGFLQRFGNVPSLPAKTPDSRRIWLQAVSVGEMLAIGPLIDRLYAAGNVEIYLTTTTSTGIKIAREKYASKVIGVGYFPVDFWLFSCRAWNRIRPDLVILTEGERWPELLHQAASRNVPIVAVNARLSDRSFARMQRVRWVAAPLMRGITRVLAASSEDASRFKALGFSDRQIEVTGNIKLDLTLPLLDPKKKTILRTEMGLGDGPVLLGSSTWPGEEARLLEVFRALRKQDPTARLLLVPRHAERRGELDTLLAAAEFSHHFRSRGTAAKEVDIAVGDTTGELRLFTQLARVAVIGKSFAPHTEGQTPVEAAALGTPMIFGPGMANFRTITKALLAARAAQQANEANLAETVIGLWRDESRSAAQAGAAATWLRTNQGAVERTVKAIQTALEG